MKKSSSGLLEKKESKHILIAIIILTIVFGFNDNKPSFVLSQWFLNLIIVFVLVTITILVHMLGYKLAGMYFNCPVIFEIWNFKNVYNTQKRLIKKIKVFFNGPFIAILLTLITTGKFYFAAISTFSIKHTERIERKFSRVTEYETALIALIGLVINLILLFIFKGFNIEKGILINTYFILLNLLPISSLDGAKILLGSKTLYIFSIIFFVTSIILIHELTIFTTIIISIILAIILTLIYYIKVEYTN